MTVDEVKRRVDDIASGVIPLQTDDESLHAKEDDLYLDVLRAVAAGECDDAVGCAREALRVSELDFSRWYA